MMSEHSIEQLSDFLHEISALSKTELPLDLGMEGQPETIAQGLAEIEVALRERVARGQAIEDAVRDEPTIPTPLRSSLITWIRCDDPTIALDMLGTTALKRQQYSLSVGHALVYPLLVVLLTYVGLLVMCLLVVPTIESVYEQLDRQPGTGLQAVQTMRDLIPLWGPAFPVVIAVLLIWWRKRWPMFHLPGSQQSVGSSRNSELATRLAELIDGGLSVDEALTVLSPMSEELDGSARRAGPPASLLRWAINTDLGDQARTPVLRFVARMYRQKAQRQAAYWRVLVPTLVGLFIGGICVLGYGLSFFVPLVQLLKDVALPGGV